MANPTCPHCKSELDRVETRWVPAPTVSGKIYLISCPNCSRVLGVVQERD
jgi:uncharacterized protein YbaR (Trm112 family)